MRTRSGQSKKLLFALVTILLPICWSAQSYAQFYSVQRSPADLEKNRAQAKEVARALQDQELGKLSKKLSAHSKEVMGNNPDAAAPATALSIGAMLWIGHKINFVKSDDLKLSSRLEGRGRCGSINLDSPLLNSKLNFAQEEGVKFGLNKNLDKINSDAELNYLFKGQLVSTEFRHHLTRNLALCVGLSQSNRAQASDQNARIQYNINF